MLWNFTAEIRLDSCNVSEMQSTELHGNVRGSLLVAAKSLIYKEMESVSCGERFNWHFPAVKLDIVKQAR